MDKVEIAYDRAQSSPQAIIRWIESIRFGWADPRISFAYMFLASEHLALGVYDYFGLGNKTGFKQNLHVVTQLELASIAIKDYQRFEVGNEIKFALLSDNPIIIDKVARLEPKDFVSGRDNPLYNHFKVHMWQLAILGDYEALEKKVHRLAKNGRKKDRELPALGKDFFSLLMRADKQGLEDLIAQHAKIKSQDALTEDFMCHEGTIEAKICWLKGIQVQIDSPLLPMGLMPIEPVAHYDDVYDFLSPDYIPPKIGMWERMRYWYKQRQKNKADNKRLMEMARNNPRNPLL